jgi:hypothetical protein
MTTAPKLAGTLAAKRHIRDKMVARVDQDSTGLLLDRSNVTRLVSPGRQSISQCRFYWELHGKMFLAKRPRVRIPIVYDNG